MALTRGGRRGRTPKRRSSSSRRRLSRRRSSRRRSSRRVSDEVLDIVPPVGKFTRSVLHDVGISRGGGKRCRHRRTHRR